MIKEIYSAICARIGGVECIKYIDIWQNQVIDELQNLPFETPAVFVDFESVEWQDASGGMQTGQLIIGLHIVRTSLADSYSGSSNAADALEIFEVLDQVHTALQGLADEDIFGPMFRTWTIKDNYIGPYQVYVVRYESGVTDRSAVKAWQAAQLENINLQRGSRPESDGGGGKVILPGGGA